MSTITKIAFYDPATDEYYCGEQYYQKLSFKDDISKAKLYTGNSPDFTSGFNYVKSVSQRNLICIDVEVSFNPIKIDNNIVGSKISDKIDKIRSKFDPLDVIAKKDVDDLSEKDYQQWKKMRNQLRELGQTV